MMSLQTHVALTHIDQEPGKPDAYAYEASSRDTVESAPSVSRLRRRLAQMHLTPVQQA